MSRVIDCPACGGSGRRNNGADWCPDCNGRGEVRSVPLPRKSNNQSMTDYFVKEALDRLQFLDEIGGPDAVQYVDVMRRIADECTQRAWIAAESQLYSVESPARVIVSGDARANEDMPHFKAQGFSWEYPGFFNREISGGVCVTVGYDNGPKRFCVQLADNDGGQPDWPAGVSDERGDCETREEVFALVEDLDRAFMSPAARNDLDRKEQP